MSRGFVTIATGKNCYYILARNLLASYRFHNPNSLPFAIICDRENEYTKGFDDVVIMDSPAFSYLDKLRLPELAPYDETIFIDADCLVLRDLGGLWNIVANSPDYGIYGAVLDPDSEEGRIELERSGRLRDKMHSPCSCQGGMRFVRKSPRLASFMDLCMHILEHYDEFQKPGHRKPTDDMILPLACSIFDFPPSEDWWRIFCYLPESEIIECDVPQGRLRFIWRVNGAELGPDCYFLHFSTSATKEWLYGREAYRLLCEVEGKSLSVLSLGLIWLRGSYASFLHKVVYPAKSKVYKMICQVKKQLRF